MSKALLWGIGLMAASQAITVPIAIYQDSEITDAAQQAASGGLNTFQLSGAEVAMVNGRKSGSGDPGCSVNLIYTASGDFITKWNGLLLDFDNKDHVRVYIDDCSKLPKGVFLPHQNG